MIQFDCWGEMCRLQAHLESQMTPNTSSALKNWPHPLIVIEINVYVIHL